MKLEPIDPETAVELYLSSRKQECTDSTIQNHRYRLKQFLRWCDKTGFDEMNDMSGRTAEEYKLWRWNECDLKTITIEQQLRTLRVFLKYCESNEFVEPGVAEKIIIPDVSDSDQVDETMLDHERAEEILEYLDQFAYATTKHVLLGLLWHTGMRIGSAIALDVDDWHSNTDDPYLSVRHRPETDTPLKLKEKGERNLSITDATLIEALDDYIAYNRPDTTDEYGRRPLFASKQGRMYHTTLRRKMYELTRPCVYSNECPHGRDIDDCEAVTGKTASPCPSSLTPHPVRRGAITAHLNADVPKEIASERMAVSTDTLEKHYDARTKEDKRNRRKDYLDNI